MELWRIYRLCSFIKDNPNKALQITLANYRKKYQLSEEQLRNVWDSTWGKYAVVNDGIVSLILEGKQLAEFKGVGFINAELKQFNPIITAVLALIAGGLIREIVLGIIWIFRHV